MKSFIAQVKEEKELAYILNNYEDIEQDLYLLRKQKLLHGGLNFHLDFNYLLSNYKDFINLPLASLVKEFINFIYFEKSELRTLTKPLIMFDEDFSLKLSCQGEELFSLPKTFYQSPLLDVPLIKLIKTSDMFKFYGKVITLNITLLTQEDSRKSIESQSFILDTQKYLLGKLHTKHLITLKEHQQFRYIQRFFNQRIALYKDHNLKKDFLDNMSLPFSDFGFTKIIQIRYFLDFFWRTEHSNEDILLAASEHGTIDYHKLLWEAACTEKDLLYWTTPCGVFTKKLNLLKLIFLKVLSNK